MTQQLLAPDGAVMDVPDEEVSNAISDGGYKPIQETPTTTRLIGPDGTPVSGAESPTIQNKPILLIAPDGTPMDVPKGEAAEAIQKGGYQTEDNFKVDNAAKVIAERVAARHSDSSNELESFGEAFSNTVLLGQGRKIGDFLAPYFEGKDRVNNLKTEFDLTDDQLTEATHKSFDYFNAQNPKSTIAGAVAGAVAPLVATGGAGLFGEGAAATRAGSAIKAAIGTTSALQRITGAVAGGAAEGAILNTPQAIAQLAIDKNPQAAAETIGLGVLMGGGIGTITQGGREAITGAFAGAKAAARSIGEKMYPPSIRQIPTTAEEQMAEATALGLAGERDVKLANTKTEVVQNHSSNMALLDQIGVGPEDRAALGTPKQIDENLNLVIDSLGGPEKVGKLNKMELAEKVLNLNDLTGSKIGTRLLMLDRVVAAAPKLENALPSVDDQIEKLRNLLETSYKGPLHTAEASYINKAIQQYEHVALNKKILTFQEQENIKRVFQSLANYDQTSSLGLNNVRRQVASIARQETVDAADRLVQEEPTSAKLIKNWKDMKQSYSFLQDIKEAAKKTRSQAPDISTHIGALHVFGVGGLVGHALSPIVGPVGPLVGAMAGQFVRRWMRDKGLTKLAAFMRKNADSPEISSYIAADAAAVLQNKTGDIAKKLAETAPVKAFNSYDGIKEELGEEANGLSKEQQYHKLHDIYTTAVANPEHTRSSIDSMFKDLAYYHPELAKDAADHMMQKIQVIHDAFPKEMPMQPFTKAEKRYPSPDELQHLNEVLAIANNPFSVIDKIKAGTLTQKQVNVLQQLNPAITSTMQSEVMKTAYDPKYANLDYQQRTAASMFIGQPMGNVQQLQSIWNNAPAEQPQQPPAKKGGHTLNTSKMPGAQYTQAQNYKSTKIGK